MQSDQRARSGDETGFGDPVTGRVLDGRYRVGPRIARGGMASVYEATDLRLDRIVAVKVMHPGLGDGDDFAARFVREARAAARLSHPHVVAVHDQGTDDGTVFLVMELVAGHTLRDVVRKEAPMPPARRWRWSSRCSRRWPTPTARAWSTATSSPRTCSSPTSPARTAAGSRSPTSGWPRPSAPTPSTPRPAAS